ncbi:MAG: transporter [Azospira oryzae]|nr:MAG: transporter [Azospira oryzae]
MKNIKYLFIGVVFGLALTKGEAISWYRIQEMFRFESFHMFGIFMTAIPTGALFLFIIKKQKLNTFEGEVVDMPVKKYSHGIVIGSLIFGFGWALTGACPGPLYAQIGSGSWVTGVTLLSAIAGTWTYGLLQNKLPE